MNGTVLHYDGAQWNPVDVGVDNRLYAVWGTGPNDVFVIGWGTALHFDGQDWIEITEGLPSSFIGFSLSGNDTASLYTVGYNYGSTSGRVYRFDPVGVRWDQVHSGPRFDEVHVAADNSVFVGAHDTTIHHFDGQDWSIHNLDATNGYEIGGIWAAAPDDVFAVGNRWSSDGPTRGIFHFDGEDWTTITTGGNGTGLHAVWGTSPTNVFAVGEASYHFDGESWREIDVNEATMYAVSGFGSGLVFAVGESGNMSFRVGANSWTTNAVTGEDLRGVWGSSANDVWAVGHGGVILHNDGDTWTPVDSGTNEDLRAIWGDGANDVFAVGTSGTVLHFDGDDWSSQSLGATVDLNSVWGSAGDDIYAVGAECRLFHYDGQAWDEVIVPGADCDALTGIWGSGPEDIFAVSSSIVGRDQLTLRYDGNSWTIEDVTESLRFTSIHGCSATEVYATNHVGDILRFDGSVWRSSRTAPMGAPQLRTVLCLGTDDVWAFGAAGATLRRDGLGWDVHPDISSVTLHGAWGSSSNELIVVGEGGTILRRAP